MLYSVREGALVLSANRVAYLLVFVVMFAVSDRNCGQEVEQNATNLLDAATPTFRDSGETFRWMNGRWQVFFAENSRRSTRNWRIHFSEPVQIETREKQRVAITYSVSLKNQFNSVSFDYRINEFIDWDSDADLPRLYGTIRSSYVSDGIVLKKSNSRFLHHLKQTENKYSHQELKDGPCILENIGGIRLARTIRLDSNFTLEFVCQKLPESRNRNHPIQPKNGDQSTFQNQPPPMLK